MASCLVLVLAMAGCASAEPAAEEVSPSPTRSASVKPTRSATPTPEPSPEARQVGFTCFIELPREHDWEAYDYDYVSLPNVQAAWAQAGLQSCEVRVTRSGPYSTTEQQAATAAGYDTVEKVDTLWSMCSQREHSYATRGALNSAQQAEANGMLILCPDHPGANVMANGSQEQNERNAGLRFGDGVREVNTRIQPGIYRTTGPVENCYWARLDSAGGIIDNNFVLAATQVEVTVQGTDFSLHTDGCGELVKVG